MSELELYARKERDVCKQSQYLLAASLLTNAGSRPCSWKPDPVPNQSEQKKMVSAEQGAKRKTSPSRSPGPRKKSLRAQPDVRDSSPIPAGSGVQELAVNSMTVEAQWPHKNGYWSKRFYKADVVGSIAVSDACMVKFADGSQAEVPNSRTRHLISCADSGLPSTKYAVSNHSSPMAPSFERLVEPEAADATVDLSNKLQKELAEARKVAKDAKQAAEQEEEGPRERWLGGNFAKCEDACSEEAEVQVWVNPNIAAASSEVN